MPDSARNTTDDNASPIADRLSERNDVLMSANQQQAPKVNMNIQIHIDET